MNRRAFLASLLAAPVVAKLPAGGVTIPAGEVVTLKWENQWVDCLTNGLAEGPVITFTGQFLPNETMTTTGTSVKYSDSDVLCDTAGRPIGA